jgi:mono/diheme cytochrome c family protein
MSARSTRRAASALVIAATVAGCGGGGAVAGISGPAVFVNHCATCHSLSGSSAPQQQGGDLRHLRLPRAELLQYSAEMPPVHGRLSPPELRAVVSYLQSVERR